MGADVLAPYVARPSVTMVFAMLSWIDLVPAYLGLMIYCREQQ